MTLTIGIPILTAIVGVLVWLGAGACHEIRESLFGDLHERESLTGRQAGGSGSPWGVKR